MSADLTDRDRLVLALDELRHRHGYWTPNPAALECCRSCAVYEVPDEPLDLPFVTWHMQSDEVAFAYGWVSENCMTCFHHGDRLGLLCGDADDVDEDFRIAWAGDTREQLDLDEAAHRAEAHQTLRNELNLLWSGDASLICEVLRRHGLDAREPVDSGTSVAILPTGTSTPSQGRRYKQVAS